jgi:hypothetical protein
MPSMRFNACLDSSHHGPPHLFRDAGASVRHPQCDMPLCFQQKPHIEGCLGVVIGANREDSSQVNVEAILLVFLYVSIGHDGCY